MHTDESAFRRKHGSHYMDCMCNRLYAVKTNQATVIALPAVIRRIERDVNPSAYASESDAPKAEESLGRP